MTNGVDGKFIYVGSKKGSYSYVKPTHVNGKGNLLSIKYSKGVYYVYAYISIQQR